MPIIRAKHNLPANQGAQGAHSLACRALGQQISFASAPAQTRADCARDAGAFKWIVSEPTLKKIAMLPNLTICVCGITPCNENPGQGGWNNVSSEALAGCSGQQDSATEGLPPLPCVCFRCSIILTAHLRSSTGCGVALLILSKHSVLKQQAHKCPQSRLAPSIRQHGCS